MIRRIISKNDTEAISETKNRLSDGASFEEVIGFLRDRGLNKIHSITVLSKASGISLDVAKEIVHESEAWSDKKSSDGEFQSVLSQSLDMFLRREKEKQKSRAEIKHVRLRA